MENEKNTIETKTALPDKLSPIVLVGTYKGDQLTKWQGWYNYPISDNDSIDEAKAARICELWLFQGTKEQKTYKAEFVGIKTHEELVRDYGYPAKGKAHGERYLLFRTEFKYDTTDILLDDTARVIVRTKDFAGRSPHIAAQLKAYLEKQDRNAQDLAERLPSILAQLPPKQLCVCEEGIQLSFWDLPEFRFYVQPNPGAVIARKYARGKPFVKWAGGKGQLLEQLDALLPADFASREELTYVEPFVGGGAMLFHVLAKYPNIKRAVINDINADLITCYQVIKTRPEELIASLKELHTAYKDSQSEKAKQALYFEKRTRYNTREADAVETAALFVFLNRTCFNGLYRVNSKGQYNVPFGKSVNPLICDETTIRADSELLQKVDIHCGDFEQVLQFLDDRAFFYFDPPYRPLTQTSAFTAYSMAGFDDKQQERLAVFSRRLDLLGNQWLLSNSDPHNSNPNDSFFDDLYNGFNISRVSATRMINSNAEGRGKISELVIRNYRD